MDTPLVLMDAQRISRSAKRMAYEIVEKNAASRPVVLFGIDHRGFAVAKLLETKNISDNLQPTEIHTAVMIDRGHRQFPIRAEFYGMELPTKVNEHVSVVVEDLDVKKVILEKR